MIQRQREKEYHFLRFFNVISDILVIAKAYLLR